MAAGSSLETEAQNSDTSSRRICRIDSLRGIGTTRHQVHSADGQRREHEHTAARVSRLTFSGHIEHMFHIDPSAHTSRRLNSAASTSR
jgi:hypothetical protein